MDIHNYPVGWALPTEIQPTFIVKAGNARPTAKRHFTTEVTEGTEKSFVLLTSPVTQLTK